MGMYNMSNMKSMLGFTLIELMIAVVIIGILATIVYPSYQDSIRKSRRADAITELLKVQQLQEKWRANNTAYGAQADILGASTYTSPGGYYTVAIAGQSATAYTATATATGAQAGDSACATIVLNQDGPDKSTTAKAACWGS